MSEADFIITTIDAKGCDTHRVTADGFVAFVDELAVAIGAVLVGAPPACFGHGECLHLAGLFDDGSITLHGVVAGDRCVVCLTMVRRQALEVDRTDCTGMGDSKKRSVATKVGPPSASGRVLQYFTQWFGTSDCRMRVEPRSVDLTTAAHYTVPTDGGRADGQG